MASQRPLLMSLVALGLAACASPGGPAQLTGTVTYRERIALPGGAVVRVTLLDVSLLDAPERVIAEQEIHPTAQVPIPFALAFDRAAIDPERRYGLRASIADATGRVLWATAASHPALTQGAPDSATIVVQRPREGSAPAGPRVFAYACDGFAFRVEVTRERALLFLPGRGSRSLPAARAASGAKYTDGSTIYWSKGDEALLTLDGVEHTGCRVEPLRAP
jgi:putative lipoprotein